MFSLQGKRALVTGGSKGIGAGLAEALREQGAAVTILSREASGENTLACDVTNIHAFRTLIEAQPAFDIFVNNAGMNKPQPFLEVDEATFDAITTLNIKAAYFAAQSVARVMVWAGKAGSIINLSSQMGFVGAANRTVYCATKHAMEGFTKAMAIELAPHKIRVNTLCPTFIETPMTKPYLENEAFKASVLTKIKLGRVGQVSDLTGACVFLASEASGMMTGSHLLIDGGWTAE